MHIYLIFNPKAGGGKAGDKIDQLKNLLALSGISYKLAVTEYKGHATDLTANLDVSPYDGIVAAGGDGTFFEVLNGYFKNKHRNSMPLGILPMGTGNSLTQDIMEKEHQLENFVRLLKKGYTKPIDVIKVKNSSHDFYYANTMGLGFVSDVNITANRIKFFGKTAYTLGVIYNTIRLRSYPVKITIDNSVHELKNVFISFSNSRYTGGNYLLAPDARIDDGFIDLIIVNKLSRINLLKTFPLIFSGKHVETRFVDTLKGKHVFVETASHKFLSPDGELLGYTPAEITCIPQAIRIFADIPDEGNIPKP